MTTPATEPTETEQDWESCNCPLCDGPRDAAVLRHEFPRASYYRCSGCGLVYMSPRLTEGAMLRLYRSADYYAGGNELGYDTYEEDARVYRRTFERRLRELTPFASSGRLLDIGCGTGVFVDVAAAAGFEAHGLDASDYGASVAERSGDRSNIRTGTLETADYPEGHFDVVTMFDLFEHLYHPLDFTERLARITADGGLVAIATPNYDSWMRRALGSRTVSFKIPEHVCYYTRETLAVATRSHFDIVHCKAIGQYCSPAFLRHRLDTLSPWLGRAFGCTVGWTGWQPYVPSGSLLALLRKR